MTNVSENIEEKKSLHEHVRKIHEPCQLFVCDHCDFKTNDKISLKQHTDSIQLGVRHFVIVVMLHMHLKVILKDTKWLLMKISNCSAVTHVAIQALQKANQSTYKENS